MESLFNYIAFQIKIKMIDLLPGWQQITDSKTNKINCYGIIMHLEHFFLKIISIFWLFLSKSNVQGFP